MTIRTVIVDDQAHTRKDLRGFLDSEDDIQIVHECGTGHEAVAAIRSASPDLVFLEAKMPDMNGFEVIEAIQANRSPVLVFVTDKQEYAPLAFDLEATDFLLKPVEPARFRRAMTRARRRLALDSAANGGASTGENGTGGKNSSFAERIPVKTSGRVRFVDLADVHWVDAAGNYIRLNTDDGTFLYRATMTAFEQKLDPKRFLRIHRSTIIATDRIREIEFLPHGDYAVRLLDGQRLTVSRTYRDRLQPLMKTVSRPSS